MLRYVGSDAGRQAPTAFVRATPGSESLVRMVAAPGTASDELPFPGTNLVVIAHGPASIDITIRARDEYRSLDAKFNLELLAKGEDEPARVVERPVFRRPMPSAPQAGFSGLELGFVAHIARRGDVTIPEGEWAAGPIEPAPIEGIQLRCSGADLGIEAQFSNTRERGRWSPWLPPQAFIGTRGQARPLTGLRLRLTGEDRDGFLLEAEALFLGSPIVTKRHREMELSSSAGVDPLVGLRLRLTANPVQQEAVPEVPNSPRVRVFRANRAASGG